MRARQIAVACLLVTGAASGQTPVIPGAPVQPPIAAPGALAIDEYLFILQQIAPAARGGAEAYLQAHASRCGRRLGVSELRQRVADGAGDPLLMQMMRAAHGGDRQRMAALAASIRCAPDR